MKIQNMLWHKSPHITGFGGLPRTDQCAVTAGPDLIDPVTRHTPRCLPESAFSPGDGPWDCNWAGVLRSVWMVANDDQRHRGGCRVFLKGCLRYSASFLDTFLFPFTFCNFLKKILFWRNKGRDCWFKEGGIVGIKGIRRFTPLICADRPRMGGIGGSAQHRWLPDPSRGPRG